MGTSTGSATSKVILPPKPAATTSVASPAEVAPAAEPLVTTPVGFEDTGAAKGESLDFGYTAHTASASKSAGEIWGTKPAFAANVGTSTASVGVDPKQKHNVKIALPASAELTKANAAELPGLKARFVAPDPKAQAFARLGIDGMLASLVADQADEPKTKQRDATQLMIALTRAVAPGHLAIVQGDPKTVKGLSEQELAARVRLSSAILAELGERITTSLPLDKAIFEMPDLLPYLVSVSPEAMPALKAGVEKAYEAHDVLNTVGFIRSLDMKLSKSDMSDLASATALAKNDPAKAWEKIETLAAKAEKYSEKHPEVEEQEEEEAAKGPTKSPKQLMKESLARVAALEGEIAGAKAPTELERFKGAMVGAAIGDALGAGTEFTDREWIRAEHGLVTDLIGGGEFEWEPGAYTDDTQMAVAMAESIVQQKGFDIEDVGDKFRQWLDSQPPDVGNLTRAALKLKKHGVPAEHSGAIAWALQRGAPGPFENAGNGSVMRASPVALLTSHRSVDEIEQLARASSVVTHADPRAAYGTAAISLAVSLIVKGETDVTGKVAEWLKDKSPVLSEAIGAVKSIEDFEELRTSGYVVHTVQAAFWALEHATNFVDGAVKVANLGEDTDTAAATAGILLGAKFGIEGIPESWRKKLIGEAKIEKLATQIHQLAAE